MLKYLWVLRYDIDINVLQTNITTMSVFARPHIYWCISRCIGQHQATHHMNHLIFLNNGTQLLLRTALINTAFSPPVKNIPGAESIHESDLVVTILLGKMYSVMTDNAFMSTSCIPTVNNVEQSRFHFFSLRTTQNILSAWGCPGP